MPTIPIQSTVSVSSNCSSLPGIARAEATFANYHRFSSLSTHRSPPHYHRCHIFCTCDFDLRGSGLSGASKVPSTTSVPPSVPFLDPRDHQVPLPHNLELVRRGQVQELAILDPPGDVKVGKNHLLKMWIHLTTGFGWPSGGEQPRMTLSPIVAVVFTGLIRKSLWMSARKTLK